MRVCVCVCVLVFLSAFPGPYVWLCFHAFVDVLCIYRYIVKVCVCVCVTAGMVENEYMLERGEAEEPVQ